MSEAYMVICEHCGPLGVADSRNAFDLQAAAHARDVHGTPVIMEVISDGD